MPHRILLVDTDTSWLDSLRISLADVGDVDVCEDFPSARARLLTAPTPDFLVTNVRLGAYNGLHLVMLVASANLPTRCLTYGAHGNRTDMALAQEAQRAGTFYEPSYRLAHALPAYLRSTLPPNDRRQLAREDRRATFRGGRRATDSSLLRPPSENDPHYSM
jgi:DNA-binding NtrC family response regulator